MELVTSWQIYWFTRLDMIQGVGIVFILLGVIVSFISGLITLVTDPQREKSDHVAARTIFRWSFPMFIFGVIIACFVPNSKEAAAIWAIPKVINNPQVQSIGTNTLNIAEIGIKYLRDKIENKLEQ